MARTIRDTNLESRAGRARLKSRGKPYYRVIEPGLHLGYRKPIKGAGKWTVRLYLGNENYLVETISTADDFSDADGAAILNFKEAQNKARERMVRRAHNETGRHLPISVREAVARYIDFLDSNRKTANDARYRANAFIIPELGDVEVERLTADQLRKWHINLAKSAPRLRTKRGQTQQFRIFADDDSEWLRRRRATANRTLTVLKGALNRVWREGAVASDQAWRSGLHPVWMTPT